MSHLLRRMVRFDKKIQDLAWACQQQRDEECDMRRSDDAGEGGRRT